MLIQINSFQRYTSYTNVFHLVWSLHSNGRVFENRRIFYIYSVNSLRCITAQYQLPVCIRRHKLWLLLLYCRRIVIFQQQTYWVEEYPLILHKYSLFWAGLMPLICSLTLYRLLCLDMLNKGKEFQNIAFRPVTMKKCKTLKNCFLLKISLSVCSASIFNLEDGGSMFLWNYSVSHPRRHSLP
jgi:hypothetical protein